MPDAVKCLLGFVGIGVAELLIWVCFQSLPPWLKGLLAVLVGVPCVLYMLYWVLVVLFS